MLNRIIDQAVKEGASDIHISEGIFPVLRVNGELVMLRDSFSPMSDVDLEQCVNSLLANNRDLREQYREDKQIDLSFVRDHCRFRVHIYCERGGIAIAMRLIPTNIPSIDKLNLPKSIKQFTKLKNGLVLVTGTTGTGKSTTLAALIDDINTHQNKHIITVEDPIEFFHQHKNCIIHQREVGRDVLNFVDAVKAAVREDPDILLVGEMRDLDTIQQAITLAETGHLVFGTLHTKSAAETVDRIIDVFPPNQQQQIRLQVSNVLEGVISQRLIKAKNGNGQIPVCEVMIVNDAIRNVIKECGPPSAILDQLQINHKKNGSQTLAQALAYLYNKNMVSYDVALQLVDSEEMFKRMIVATRKEDDWN